MTTHNAIFWSGPRTETSAPYLVTGPVSNVEKKTVREGWGIVTEGLKNTCVICVVLVTGGDMKELRILGSYVYHLRRTGGLFH